MRFIPTEGRALQLAVVIAAGAVLGAGVSVSVAEGAQDVDALGKQLARSESRAERLKIVADLGRSGDPTALAHLLDVIGEGNLGVRRRAGAAMVSVLEAAGGDDPARLLVAEALSADLSPVGQMEVVSILDKLSPPGQAASAIFRFLGRGRLAKHVARQCVNVVRKPRYVDLDCVRDSLLDLVETGEASVSAAAASALGRMRLSENDKPEVVQVLVDQLGLGNDEAGVREAARKSLGLVTGEGEKSTSGWRSWAVAEGYGDPIALEPEDRDELERREEPVVFTPVDSGASVAVSSPTFVVVGIAAAAAMAILLALRSMRTRYMVRAIEAKRWKHRPGRRY